MKRTLLVMLVALLLAGVASASTGDAAVLRALQSRPVYKEDTSDTLAKASQLRGVAAAIYRESKRQKVASFYDWAALMIAIGEHESSFSLRIHSGFCFANECDGGRARGPWQLHAYGVAKERWEDMHGLDTTAVQAHAASRALERGYNTCRGQSDWLIATVNGFAGKRCDANWRGLEERVATWRKVRGSMR